MTRVKRGKTKLAKRKRLLKHAKGFKWARKSKLRAAREALMHAWTYQFRDRKARKRDFRRLWQIRINAATRAQGISYSNFAHLLKENKVELDRKVLSELAMKNPEVFEKIVEKVKKSNS